MHFGPRAADQGASSRLSHVDLVIEQVMSDGSTGCAGSAPPIDASNADDLVTLASMPVSACGTTLPTSAFPA